MPHQLKFFAYKYINKKHSKSEAFVFIVLSKLVCFIVSAPTSIGLQISDEIKKGELKTALRRLVWLVGVRLGKKSLFGDDFFDFSIGLETQAALDSYKFYKQLQFKDRVISEITLAQLSSAVLESQVRPGEKKQLSDLNHSQFDAYFEAHFDNATRLNSGLLYNEPLRQQSVLIEKNETDENRSEPVNSDVGAMHKYALGVLKEVNKFLKEIGVKNFVISGTFLGMIRDNGFIAHDTDIDLGVMESDLPNDIVSMLQNLAGFRVSKPDYPCFRKLTALGDVFYERSQKPALIKLIHNSGVQTDIFTHFIDGDKYWHGSSIHRWDNKAFDLVERPFLGMNLLSPENFELYLTENYGNWRVPVKQFNCSTGTPNVVISDSCKTHCYFLKREYFSNLH